MTPRLTPISGCGAKGPACFLVETSDARIVLDLGYGPQPGLWPDVSGVGRVDAVLLSHSHRDHAGALDLLPKLGDPTVYATDIAAAFIGARAEVASLPLRGWADVCGIRVTTGRNGHAPGGVWLHLDIGGGFLYMGDFSVESDLYAYDAPPRAKTVVIDASYGTYDASLAQFAAAIDARLDAGPVLLPVPAAGRGAEIALHVARARRTLPHIDDALRDTLVKLSRALAACLRADTASNIARIAFEAPRIERAEGVMLACIADATSGDAARLVDAWENEASPDIVFTGYLPPGTPAERLTRSGRARYLRWNVHPRLSDNVTLVRACAAHTVVPAFADASHVAAWQFAFAPARVAVDGTVAL